MESIMDRNHLLISKHWGRVKSSINQAHLKLRFVMKLDISLTEIYIGYFWFRMKV